MMSDEFEQQGFRRRPGQGGSVGRQRPGLQIGQIGGKRAERVLAHPPIWGQNKSCSKSYAKTERSGNVMQRGGFFQEVAMA